MTMNNPGDGARSRLRGCGALRAGTGTVPARTGGDDVIKTVRRDEPKVGRNDPCPCGSGKKYKKCHGQQREETSQGLSGRTFREPSVG